MYAIESSFPVIEMGEERKDRDKGRTCFTPFAFFTIFTSVI